MNRLNDINRNGIYPVTKETLLAIEDNFQMIVRVLDGLGLPNGTAVQMSGTTALSAYMFLYYGNSRSEIVKVAGTGTLVPTNQISNMANLQANPQNFVLTPANVSTTIIGTDGVTEYADCIVEEKYTLTYSAGGNMFWKYYTLEEVLGIKTTNIVDSVFILPDSNWNITKNKCFVRPMVGKKHFHIDLELSRSQLVQGKTRTISMAGEIVDSINALLGTSGNYTHPLQVSMFGSVASGYITQDYGDTITNIICNNHSVVENTAAQKIQIAGDIWL